LSETRVCVCVCVRERERERERENKAKTLASVAIPGNLGLGISQASILFVPHISSEKCYLTTFSIGHVLNMLFSLALYV
jgi:hypothetical protein